jgi:hypothetical protein
MSTLPTSPVAESPRADTSQPFAMQLDSLEQSVATHLKRVWARHHADVIALGALFVMTAAGLWLRWVYDNWLGEFDLFTMFIPWFGYVGDRIAAGEIPAWSPHYFGGAPVAGNPSGGWMYLQVMALYAIFPILIATKMLLLTHALISGAAVYAFCRKLSMAPVAALMSSSIFVLGQILYGGTNYMTIATQASTWLVVGLLASEMAIRATRISALVGWAALLGVAVTQMFVSWPGQGVAYGCMWIGGWMLYRLLFYPMPEFPELRDRLTQCVLAGSVAVVVALSFGAAGILPMLDFLAESTVPSGDYSNVIGGEYASGTDGLIDVISMVSNGYTNFEFTIPGESFGATVIILAIFGAFRARRQYGAAYFGVMFVGFMSLMITDSPINWLFEQLPVLGPIHDHRPSGVSWMAAIGTAMLAGAAVQKLIDADLKPIRLSTVNVMFVVLALGAATVNSKFSFIGWWSWSAATAVIALYALPTANLETLAHRFRPAIANKMAVIGVALSVILAFGYLWRGFWPVIGIAGAAAIFFLTIDDLPAFVRKWQPKLPIIVSYIMVGLVFLHPTGWDWVIETSMLTRDPGTAAEFLQQQQELLGPFRYTGFSLQGEYDVRWSGLDNEGHKSGYSWRRMEGGVVGILVNARTYRLGLYQTGGYNPIQLRYYTEYVDVMNGRRQDYHWLDTFGPALTGSPLLDMLGVRYILVDKSIPDYRTVFQKIEETHEEVYSDDLTIVYENQTVFPRSWIVHDVQDNGNGFGLRMLESGNADGRETAYVNSDDEIPSVEPPLTSGPTEYARMVSYEPERIEIDASANSDGFLVLNDPYASGWNAYVDGKQTDILRTNHAFRGIELPAGQHEVVFKYEPTTLQVGLWSTGAASIALVGIWSWALVDWRRRRQTPLHVESSVAADTPDPGTRP